MEATDAKELIDDAIERAEAERDVAAQAERAAERSSARAFWRGSDCRSRSSRRSA